MKGKRRGQGLVEFALTLPVLLMIVLGITEAALVIQGHLTAQHAARKAARFAVTYQPVQGACLDQDQDGVLADGINDSEDGGDPEDLAPWPYCPGDYAPNASESEGDYYARRVELIKRIALQAATGLRIDEAHLHDFNYEDEPGFFGVKVWGYPSFQVDCNADPSQCLNHPGIEGLPVRVLVQHNVEIVDPLYGSFINRVPVQAEVQMINEGVQVGFGDIPPPSFDTNPNPQETPVATNTPPPGASPTPEPTPTLPPSYDIALNFEEAVNELPDDRSHDCVATVTDELNNVVQGAWVNFSTDMGAFDYSGVAPSSFENPTDGQGRALATIFGNEPGTARIQAWLDYDGDDTLDVNEPSDVATKTWTVTGPYIVVSDYKVAPLDEVVIGVMDHDQADDPHRLLWCVITGTETSTVVQDPVNVGADGDVTGISFEIPEDSEGIYRFETHSGSGACGDGTDLEAYSGEVRIQAALPDLTITSFNAPNTICPQSLFTVTADISNLTGGSTDATFEVDFYVDPAQAPPQRPVGEDKQWISGIGPGDTTAVNAVMWVGSVGEHTIWVKVDTSDVVEESEENNNVISYTFTTVDSLIEPADFDAGAEGFSYVDDPFGTNEPDYAQGSWISSGGYSGGALQVQVGAINGWNNDIDHMSGGWRRGFDMSAEYDVIVSFRYNLIQSYGYESSEYSQVRMSVDGTLHGAGTCSGSVQCVDEITGDGNDGEDISTGWQLAEINVGTLSPGSHTVTVGGYNRRKTYYDEFTTVLIDDVSVKTTACAGENDPSPVGGDETPPGMKECYQVLEAGGFEGNPDAVWEHWSAGGSGAYQRQSRYFYEGTVSMRLHASLGALPACEALSPFVYQTVTIPDLGQESYTDTETSLVVRGRYLVAESLAGCSIQGTTDADDELYAQLRGVTGDPFHLIAGGGTEAQMLNGRDAYAQRDDVPASTYGDGAFDDVREMANLVSRQGVKGPRKGLRAPFAQVGGINFNDHTITSYSNQDSSGDLHTIEDGGNTLHLGPGNTWKKIDFAYSVTPDTVLEFDFQSDAEGEIHGIGLDDNNTHSDNTTFRVYGTQNWGIGDFDNYSGSDWQTYEIPIGEYYTGDMIYMFFVNDHDHGDTAESLFRNVRVVYEFMVDFSDAGYSVNEDAGSIEITVSLSDQANETITVDYATSDGTATAGADYNAANGTLTFAPNDTEESFTVDILNDDVYEGDETVSLTLSTPGSDGDAIVNTGSHNPALLTIVDDDTMPTVDFSSPDYSVNEGAGPAIITATLSNPAVQPIVVGYLTSDGTATAGADYTAVSGTLMFDPNETAQTFQVPITDDLAYEADETVSLNLYSEPLNWVEDFDDLSPGTTEDTGDTAWSVSSGSGTFEVADNHSFHVSDTGDERVWQSEVMDISGAGQVDVSVTIWSEGSGLDASGDYRDWLDVYYILDGGSEQEIASYSGEIAGTQTVGQNGLTGSTLQIVIRSRTTAGDEHYYWDDVGVVGDISAVGIGPNNPATLTIIDNDGVPTVDFSSPDYQVSEDAGAATITATLSTSSHQTVTVDYVSSDGTATAPDDYVAVTTSTLAFPPNETIQTFEVLIVDDTEMDEGDETVNLELFNAQNAVLGDVNNPATLTITDDDIVVADFSSAEYGVDEDEGTGVATIYVVLSLASPTTVTVDYATSDGTATAGTDYTAISGTLTFAPGETSQTFDVPIIDDSESEGNETVDLTLSNVFEAELGDVNNPAVLTIDDDETVPAGTWQPFSVDFSNDVPGGVESLIGGDVQIRFYGEHDADEYGTWFYLDDVECEVCNEWPVPDPEPDTASIGGSIRVLVGGIPESRQGVDVWAYSQDGNVYHTITIQDGTYHFYNIEPGTYTIYSEIWIEGSLRSATTTVTVGANERNYSVNLFLL